MAVAVVERLPYSVIVEKFIYECCRGATVSGGSTMYLQLHCGRVLTLSSPGVPNRFYSV